MEEKNVHVLRSLCILCLDRVKMTIAHTYISIALCQKDFPGGLDNKEFPCSAGNQDLIPESGRSSGEGNGYTLLYFCLENFMDRGAWWARVHWVTKSWTQLSN